MGTMNVKYKRIKEKKKKLGYYRLIFLTPKKTKEIVQKTKEK
jgi:hypothetical protein